LAGSNRKHRKPVIWLQKVAVGYAAGFSGAVVFDGNKLMRQAAAWEGRWHTVKNGGQVQLKYRRATVVAEISFRGIGSRWTSRVGAAAI